MNQRLAVVQNQNVMKSLSRIVLLLILYVGLFISPVVYGIPITSSKGKTVDFVGVKSASPAGLEVQVQKDGPILTLPWSRLDLRKLETENPNIHEARKKTLAGEKVELNLGSFMPMKPKEEKPTGRGGKLAAKGIYETSLKGKASDNFVNMHLVMKLPSSKAKGIFLYVTGAGFKLSDTDKHLSAGLFDTTATPIATRGPWFSLVEQHGLAIAGIALDRVTGPKKGAAPFYEVGEGTGEALYRAIDAVAELSKREELKTIPVVMYGRDVGGGAFVYNLSQWKPERVAAVVAAKGAYYQAVPSEASAKVPLLLIQGEYDEDWQIFNAKNLAKEVFEKNVSLSPNWTLAIEPRGTSGDSLQVFTLSKAFLNTVIPMRLGDEGLKEIPPSSFWQGDFESKKVSKAGASTEWTTGKTWLPEAKFAKSWEAFANGTLQAAPPE